MENLNFSKLADICFAYGIALFASEFLVGPYSSDLRRGALNELRILAGKIAKALSRWR
jgi:hypothetical protein